MADRVLKSGMQIELKCVCQYFVQPIDGSNLQFHLKIQICSIFAKKKWIKDGIRGLRSTKNASVVVVTLG